MSGRAPLSTGFTSCAKSWSTNHTPFSCRNSPCLDKLIKHPTAPPLSANFYVSQSAGAEVPQIWLTFRFSGNIGNAGGPFSPNQCRDLTSYPVVTEVSNYHSRGERSGWIHGAAGVTDLPRNTKLIVSFKLFYRIILKYPSMLLA